MQNAIAAMAQSRFAPEALKMAMNYDNNSLRARQIGKKPSSVEVYEYWKSLPTDQAKADFMRTQRAQQIIDTGGGFAAVNPVNPAIGPVPIAPRTLKPAEQPSYIHEKNIAEETGKAQGTAQAGLGGALDDIEKMRTDVRGLIESPGFSTIYGKSRYIDPRAYDIGGPAGGSEARRKQLEGASFGIAIQKMKGLGQLSDAEGKKMAVAYTRATDPNQSEEDAKIAWEEVLGYLDVAETRAKEKASGLAPSPLQKGQTEKIAKPQRKAPAGSKTATNPQTGKRAFSTDGNIWYDAETGQRL